MFLLVFSLCYGFSSSETVGEKHQKQEQPRVLGEYTFPTNYLAPELPNPVAVASEDDWKIQIYSREYVANLVAGRLEFPWIVDVRVQGEEPGDQELFAVGNLVSSNYVLTTCRAGHLLLEDFKDKVIDPCDPCKNRQALIVVQMCSSYLGEEYDRFNTLGQYVYQSKPLSDPLSQIRHVRGIIYHPNCNYQNTDPSTTTWDYDAAMLTLSRPIFPMLPVISFMPWIRDPVTLLVADIDLLSAIPGIQKSVACYIASYGKNWNNYDHHPIVDYKVRYRAYKVDWNRCRSIFWRYCDKNLGLPACTPPPGKSDQLHCMETRAKVGSVCDHDRGAPVVCNGEVVGMVTHGVVFSYCSNLLPLPFVVIKAKSIDIFLALIDTLVDEEIFVPKIPPVINPDDVPPDDFIPLPIG